VDLANGMLAGGMGEVKLDVPVAEMTYTLPTPAMATGDCGSSQTVLEGEFVYPRVITNDSQQGLQWGIGVMMCDGDCLTPLVKEDYYAEDFLFIPPPLPSEVDNDLGIEWIQGLLDCNLSCLSESTDEYYYEEDGVRYSHLIDPTTGKPISHNLVSVTVIHPSSMTSDGLATAFNVMGWEQAIAVAEQEQLAVFLIRRTEDGFEEYASPEFDKLVTVHN